MLKTNTVKLTPEDLPAVQRIYNAITDALEALPDEVLDDGRFGALTLTAVFNLACRIAQISGINKEDFISNIGQVWDGKIEIGRGWN